MITNDLIFRVVVSKGKAHLSTMILSSGDGDRPEDKNISDKWIEYLKKWNCGIVELMKQYIADNDGELAI